MNFSDAPQKIGVPFPEAGVYDEMIDRDVRQEPFEITIKEANRIHEVEVPSHCGFVLIS